MATVTSSKRQLTHTSNTYESNGDVTIGGNLNINGTTTTIDTANLLVEDKNIIIGDVSSPTDSTADGGGITLKGASDKTINWVNSTDSWTSNQNFSAPSLTLTGLTTSSETTALLINSSNQVVKRALGSNAFNSTSFAAASHTHAASDITSGTLADARIPSLAASKITSGTFADARIPSLAASKITSGTFADARIPSLAASKITSGTLSNSRLDSTILRHRGTINVTTSSGGNNSYPFDDAHTETRVAEYGTRAISYTGASATMLTINTGGSASVFQIGAHYNGNDFYMRTRTDSSTWQTWKKLWHAGNDGSGSGLDADKLDAQEGSYYRNASNLNAGTVAAARLSTATTQGSGENSTKIATTAYVKSQGYATAGDENIIDGATSIWNADGDGDVFTYNDSNPTHNSKGTGAVIYIRGDGTNDHSLVRAGIFTSDHVSTANGYYVGTLLGTSNSTTTQVINGSGEWTGSVIPAAKLSTATTQSSSENSTKIATTAYVKNQGYVTSNTQLSNETVQDIVGGMLTGNTESGITVTYDDAANEIDFTVASQTDQNFTTTLKNKLDGIANNANNYSLPLASSSTRGGVKIGFSESGKNYPVELDSSEKMFVNVPWSDTNTNTTYSAGAGLFLSGTTFTHNDTSSQSSVNNSSGTVIQDITLDTYGHITAIGSVNLDGRYYTESESNSLFLAKSGGTMTGTITSRDVKIGSGYHLQRSNHHSGHFEGSYNNIGANDSKSNPIYTIGSSYNPNDATLGNMYGIGYTHTNASFINMTGASGWGMYVAADGDARVFLGGTNGAISSTGEHYANGSSRVFHDTYHPNADTLTTARTIAGTSFNGSANINISYNNLTNKPTIPTNNNQLSNGAGYTTNTGTLTSVGLSVGTGLDGGGTVTGSSGSFNTITLDLSELTDMTAAVNTSQDELILLDNGAERRKRFAEIFGSNAYNSTTIPTNNNQLTNGAGYVTSSGNTIIGTDSDINTSGATVIDQLNMTDGVITSHSTRTITLANLGYTGATNANNYSLPLSSSSTRGGVKIGFTESGKNYPVELDSSEKMFVNVPWTDTNTDTNTTYSAGRGLDLSGTQFQLETDLRDSVSHIGLDSGDYIQWSNNSYFRGVVNGTERFRVNSSGSFGIGTSGPTHRLNVSGPNTSPNLQSATVTSASLHLSNSDNAYGMYFACLSNGRGIIQQRRQTSTTKYDLLLQPYGGRVAIGRTSASTALHVNGTITNSIYNASNLPSASPAGQRAFAYSYYPLATSHGSVVSTNGSYVIPVYSDGSSWRAG